MRTTLRTLQCRMLRSLLTRYVDDEDSPAERAVVEEHLEVCNACRSRVRIEAAVRHTLRHRAVAARAHGTPLAWVPIAESAQPSRTGGRLLPAAAFVIGLVALGTFAGRWFFAIAPFTDVGVISDNHCGALHLPVQALGLGLVGDSACIRGCIKRGAEYVFIARGAVYAIRNQDFAGLSANAGQQVRIAGSVQRHRLTLSEVVTVQ